MPDLGLTKFAWQLIGAGIAILALIALLWSWSARGSEIERQEQLLEQIAAAATLATVQPDEDGQRAQLDPRQVPSAISILADNYEQSMQALRDISEDTEEAKRLSDEADARLADRIAEMQLQTIDQDLDTWNPWED